MTPMEPLSKKCIEQTPVHAAAANGHDACVQMLLDNTEDAEVINAKDALGQTPLMLAMANGHLNTVGESSSQLKRFSLFEFPSPQILSLFHRITIALFGLFLQLFWPAPPAKTAQKVPELWLR